MRRLILAGLVLVGALGVTQLSVPTASANHIDCSLVRCMSCDPGWVPAPTPHNCCRCLPE